MLIRRLFFLLSACFLTVPAWAGPKEAEKVVWSAELEPKDARPGEGGRIVLRAKIAPNWYIYAPTTPLGGPIPAKIELVPNKIVALTGKVAQPKPARKKDEGFKIFVETFSGSVAFGLPVKIARNAPTEGTVKVRVKWQTCTANLCLPPTTKEIPVKLALEFGPGPRADHLKPDASVPPQGAQKVAASIVPDTSDSSPNVPGNLGLWGYLGVAFTGGLLALLTPCVFPMIPITVSYFAKQNEGGKRGLAAPLAYCAGIIGTFSVLGILVAILFGAAGITGLATNPWVNLALGALFIVLALNLLGVYEIIVPSSILNRVQPQGKTGLWTPVLMGLAFSLTSFTCTVPFVGAALGAAATGDRLYPILGMLVFSSVFAAPFFLLALFPEWLSKLPRSGEWLVSVKAFMGFLELAAALKFLSNADLVWQREVLTRPIFLSIWSSIFLIAGFYLLRWLRLPKDSAGQTIGPFRRVLGFATVGAGIFLLGGLGKLDLKLVESYLPRPNYGVKNAAPTAWIDNDWQAAKARARQEGKPLLVNFTGETCTNCRLMEHDVLPHPLVTEQLGDFVPVDLYTDRNDAQSKANNAFQLQKFETVAIPMYVVIEPDGTTVRGRLDGLERNPQKFADFLKESRERVRLAANE